MNNYWLYKKRSEDLGVAGCDLWHNTRIRNTYVSYIAVSAAIHGIKSLYWNLCFSFDKIISVYRRAHRQGETAI
jgi:hypothetical protein